MTMTYYVALPFVQSETGITPGQAQECPNEANGNPTRRSAVPERAKRGSARVQAQRRSEYRQLWRRNDLEDVR